MIAPGIELWPPDHRGVLGLLNIILKKQRRETGSPSYTWYAAMAWSSYITVKTIYFNMVGWSCNMQWIIQRTWDMNSVHFFFKFFDFLAILRCTEILKPTFLYVSLCMVANTGKKKNSPRRYRKRCSRNDVTFGKLPPSGQNALNFKHPEHKADNH